MKRITEWYDDGTRKGVLVKEKHGEKEVKTLFEETDDGYVGMCALKAYEDTGFTSEQIRELEYLCTERTKDVAVFRPRNTPVKVKPIEIYTPLNCRVGMCPKCDMIVRDYANRFCGVCGQKLEWGSWKKWEELSKN